MLPGLVEQVTEEIRHYPRAELRDFLASILESVELDPFESTVRLRCQC